MKKVFLFAALVAGVMSIASCNKEQNPQTEGEKVTITVSFPEVVDSKVAMEEGQQALDLKWENDDKITVVSGNTAEAFTVASISEDGKTATFTGNAVAGEKFDVILSDLGVNYLKRDLIYAYKQDVNGSLGAENAIYEAVLKDVDVYENVEFTKEWAERHGGTFAESGCIMFNIQIPEGCTDVSHLKLIAPDRIFSSTHAEDSQKLYSRNLSFTTAQTPSDGILKLYCQSSMVTDVIPAGTQLAVILEGKNEDSSVKYLKEFTIAEQTDITPGKRNIFTLNSAGWTIYNSVSLAHDFETTLGSKGLKANWCFPYVNIADAKCTPDQSINQHFSGADGETWLYPYGDRSYIEDSTFDGWVSDKKVPMVGIINMGNSYYVNGIYLERGWYNFVGKKGANPNNANVEIWLSNDESNDTAFGTHLTQNITAASSNSDIEGDWAKWKSKRWVKFNTLTGNPQKSTVYGLGNGPLKAKYIMIVVKSDDATPLLGYSEINAEIYYNK